MADTRITPMPSLRHSGNMLELGLILLLAISGLGGNVAQGSETTAAASSPRPPKVLFFDDFSDPGALHGGQAVPGHIGQGVQGMNMGFNAEEFMDARRGTCSFWVRIEEAGDFRALESWASTSTGICSFVLYFKPEEVKDDPSALKGEIGVWYRFGEQPPRANGKTEIDGKLTAPLTCKKGDWVHVVWTWAGLEHRLYLNGELKATQKITPLPPKIPGNMTFSCPKPIDELLFLDTALSPEEVKAVFDWRGSGPPQFAAGGHGLTVTAEWGPGEKKVHASADAGIDLEERTAALRFTALDGKNGVLGTQTLDHLERGFGETLLPLSAMPPGKYRVRVEALDAKGQVCGTVESEPWELVETPWIGNKLGLSDVVQPPWTPIKSDGETLEVWGRRYVLKGGFGLPTQIIALGKELLSEPVTLKITRDGQPLEVTDCKVRITQTTPTVAHWEGSARAGDIGLRVTGRLEYDGMMLVNLVVEPPKGKSDIRIEALDLNTVLKAEHALFMNTSADDGGWWHSYRNWVPEAPGVFFDNLKQVASATSFLPYVLFCGHEVGLEWFAENRSGWRIDYSQPSQIASVEDGGRVRLNTRFANTPFVLERPIELVFGYEATPIKPLPADWRAAYVSHSPLPIKSDLAFTWAWSDVDGTLDLRGGNWNLCPKEPEAWAAKVVAPKTADGIKVAPFTNEHVLDSGNKTENDLIQRTMAAECGGVGYYTRPTAALRDYWAWNIDRWIKRGDISGLYIDEADISSTSSSLLSGSGYIKPDGTHGVGFNVLGTREKIKRLRQIFIDNGKRPLIWLPRYAQIIPHCHSFVDVVSEGEAYTFKSPNDPDFIDTWGQDLLERRSGQEVVGGPWMLGINRAQKFGFIPVFLNYIQFYDDKAATNRAFRTMHALLGLLDIIPIEQIWNGSFLKAKAAFGIGEPGVEFHGFWEQKAVSVAQADVKASYHTRKGAALIIVTNLGKQDFTGKVSIDYAALGLDPAKTIAKNPEAENATLTAADLAQMHIPGHDYRFILLEETPAKTTPTGH
jgi:Family of unknown function (DUF6067)/Concanavalin A-like lectin/glucanases superfamily